MFAYKVGSERLTLKEIEARAADNALSLGFLAESAVAHSYKQWCKQGDIVIDCGADGGWHNLWTLRHGQAERACLFLRSAPGRGCIVDKASG